MGGHWYTRSTMATYKVPQDVEADDKLIGPFSFRQFVYLIIVALAGFIAWALSQIFIGLAIIPAPVILLFGALALPLRKDQPMEIYLAAIVSFYLKPHKRLWDPEGVESLIEVSAPRVIEESRTKNLSDSEAEKRLGYLANIVDSGGWAIRGPSTTPESAMISDVFYDSQNVQDVLDTNNTVAQSFGYLMDQSAEKNRQEALNKMRQVLTETPAQTATPAPPPTLVVDPYPTDIHQKVIQPVSNGSSLQQPVVDLSKELTTPPIKETPLSTSGTPVSADIINLATNSDLSVATLSKEANRLQKKASTQDEVFLSLR